MRDEDVGLRDERCKFAPRVFTRAMGHSTLLPTSASAHMRCATAALGAVVAWRVSRRALDALRPCPGALYEIDLCVAGLLQATSTLHSNPPPPPPLPNPAPLAEPSQSHRYKAACTTMMQGTYMLRQRRRHASGRASAATERLARARGPFESYGHAVLGHVDEHKVRAPAVRVRTPCQAPVAGPRALRPAARKRATCDESGCEGAGWCTSSPRPASRRAAQPTAGLQ